MGVYSHSKISTYENCPYKYKLQYIDKIEPEIESSIEVFLGDLVHRTLEKLYRDKRFQKRVSKSGLIKFFRDLWKREFSDKIKITKEDLSAKNYRKMGEKFISDYYEKYKPFDKEIVIGIETKDLLTLPDGNRWHIRIDRLTCDEENNYYVCDYKTNSMMKTQEEADMDRQLAMYSLWVKDKFKDAKSIKLVWYMLAFNKEVISERSDEQLRLLQEEVIRKIKEIENAKEFPTKVSKLCDYCEYKTICPAFKHKLEVEAKREASNLKEDEGVSLVNKLSEIKERISSLEEERQKIEKEIMEFAKNKNVNVVFGDKIQANIRSFLKIEIPEEKKEELIRILKRKGLYEKYSMLSYYKLNSDLINEKILEDDIKKIIKIVKDYRLTLTKRKDIEL